MRNALAIVLLMTAGCATKFDKIQVTAIPGYYTVGLKFNVGTPEQSDGGMTDEAVLEALMRENLVKQGFRVEKGDIRLVVDHDEGMMLREREPYWKRHPYITSGGVLALVYGAYEVYNRKGSGSSGGGGAVPGDIIGGNLSDDRVCPLELRNVVINAPFEYHCSENALPPEE